MKALILSAAAALAMIPAAAATGAVLTIGGPLAVSCYEAALGKSVRDFDLQACDRALIEEPLARGDRLATHVNRGILLMRRGRYQEANADFTSATRLNPSHADPYLNMAFLQLRQGHGEAALPLLDRALELRARREALAYYARGIAHEQAGNFKAAYADLVRASELEPGWSMPVKELSRYKVVRTR